MFQISKNQLALNTLALTFATSLAACSSPGLADSNIPGELQGEWRYGRISSIQYQDSYTGAPAQPNGANDTFKVDARGHYERQRLLQINTYNCASSLFITESGNLQVNGDRLTFQPTKSLVKGYSCTPSNSYEKKNSAKAETYGWSLETNEYGQQVLVLVTEDGQGKAHYGRPQ